LIAQFEQKYHIEPFCIFFNYLSHGLIFLYLQAYNRGSSLEDTGGKMIDEIAQDIENLLKNKVKAVWVGEDYNY